MHRGPGRAPPPPPRPIPPPAPPPLQTSKAMVEVLSHIEVSGELQQELGDPAAIEVLHADRQVAASVTKLVGGMRTAAQ